MNMQNLKNTRGQMRVIETILAASLLLAAVSFAGIFAVAPTSPKYEIADLEKMGYSALHDLDQHGLLTPLVYNGNFSDLRTILKITLPNDVYFNLTIYNLTNGRLESASDIQILYGDSDTFSDAKNIVSLTYCLVGETAYDPKILVLRLTRG